MFRRLFLTVFLFMLIGCTASLEPEGSAAQITQETKDEVMTQITELDGSEWRWSWGSFDDTSIVAPPTRNVTLKFADGRIGGNGSCNNYFADYTQDGEQLTFSPIGSTRKACDKATMASESVFLLALGSAVSFSINGPNLELQLSNGFLNFIIDTPMETTLFVAPQFAECVTMESQKCVQVRYTAASDWQNFFDEIEGFTYEPGFDYQLRVLVEPDTAVLPEGSFLAYKLLEVVSKTPVP